MGPYLQVRVDIRVMAMKEYFTLSKDPELESDHQMQFSVISWTTLFLVGEPYPSTEDTINIF